MDPADPPRAPFLFEQHFFADAAGDVSSLTLALEDAGYQIETFAHNPDSAERAWEVVALKVDLLEERRVLALSDEMEALARQNGCVYDGWLTRVD